MKFQWDSARPSPAAMRFRLGWIALALFTIAEARAQAAGGGALARLLEASPRRIADLSSTKATELSRLAAQLDAEIAEAATRADELPPAPRIAAVGEIADALAAVDERLAATFALARDIGAMPPDAAQKQAAVACVATLNALVDASGRLRDTAAAAIDFAGVALVGQGDQFGSLCRSMATRRCRIAGATLAPLLVTGVADGGREIPLSSAESLELLRLLAATTPPEALPTLAELVRAKETAPASVILAAETVRRIGLPQEPMRGADPTLPRPEIAPSELLAIVAAVAPEKLDDVRRRARDDLLKRLQRRAEAGAAADEPYLVGGQEVRPGDWLLMRNPSPYNLFSDISPGLFTHVGVIAAVTPADGRRRVVVVDLPERGTSLPATPVDAFVKRTLHFVILRHEDEAVAKKMAAVASSVIGNPSQFDLNFRIKNVERLQGRPLAGERITTYCAGLLLLCAQETGRPRADFFPLREQVAGGKMAANLATLGLSIGEEFVSPTGPLFSPAMKVVAARDPFYSPPRAIEQAVFDHFALGMRERTLRPSLDQFQTLRLKLAEAAKKNEALARAIAAANNVSEDLDLVAGAKAAAVVETLDEVAYGASGEYRSAFDAITATGADPAADAKQFAALRQRHADLVRRWESSDLSARQLSAALVEYYGTAGKRKLDDRFFR